MHFILATISVSFGIASLIVVSIWAQDPNPETSEENYSYPTYLGKPKWTNEYFPSYHPVLMTAGFWFAQILGICMWSYIPDHQVAKIMHISFMLGAIGTMIAGLYAVVSYEQYVYLPSLTSMHSWIGVLTIIFFGTQVIGGLMLGALSAMRNSAAPMLCNLHRVSGLITLMLTTIAIVTGIQNYLLGPSSNGNYSVPYNLGSCGYYVTSNENFDHNPAGYYLKIRPGCRLGLGLGVLVCLGTIFTGLTAYARHFAIMPDTPATTNIKKASVEMEAPPIHQHHVEYQIVEHS